MIVRETRAGTRVRTKCTHVLAHTHTHNVPHLGQGKTHFISRVIDTFDRSAHVKRNAFYLADGTNASAQLISSVTQLVKATCVYMYVHILKCESSLD